MMVGGKMMGKTEEKKITRTIRRNWKDWVFYAVIVCIPVVQFCIMYLGVNFNSLIMSFQQYDVNTGIFSWNGFHNYIDFFEMLGTDRLWLTMLGNSTIAFLVAQFITKTLAIFFSYYMFKKYFGYKVLRIILFIPSVISTLVTVVVFARFVDGAFPELFGMERGGLSNPDTTFFYILFYNVWIAFGPSLLVYSSAMNDVPPAVTEAAKLDGCGSFREFWNIIFPNIWSTYVVFTVATLATYFGNNLNLYPFYGPGADTKLYTFGYWLFRETELNKATMDNYPFLSAVGVCFTMILVPIVMLIRKCMLKFGPRPD